METQKQKESNFEFEIDKWFHFFFLFCDSLKRRIFAPDG